MAISIKDPALDPEKILQAFGWATVADQMLHEDVHILVSPLALKFVHKGKVITGCTGKPIVWSQAVKGYLDSQAYTLYEEALDEAVYEVVEWLKKKGKTLATSKPVAELIDPYTAMELLSGNNPPKDPHPLSAKNVKKTLAKTKQKAEATPIPKIPQADIPGWPYVSESGMISDPVVPLGNAHAMYQPVKTTSKEKRYFLVAGNEHIRVAARYHSNTLSIRVEGPLLGSYSDVLHDAGLGDDKGGYYSIHVSCADRMEAQKALGAAIAGIGLMDTPMPDMGLLEGKG